MLKQFDSIAQAKQIRQQAWQQQQSIGLVATMGALHSGHIALLQQSQAENDITLLSIFVNPTQFNQAEDLANYPNTLASDKKIAADHGVDYLFLPNYQTMYPDGYHYQVLETTLSKQLEGQHRPGHLSGVLTIVLKLLQLFQPKRAYFGEKDYQQYRMVKGMAEAFLLDTKIVACKTVRDNDGLALSSRNRLLSPSQRQLAAQFPRLLASQQSCHAIKKQLSALGFVVDYVEIHENRRYAAVFLGEVRLIDNILLESLC